MLDQPPARRRFQFRLRTMMIVVTLLAVACAVVAWVIRDRERLTEERDRLIQERDDAIDRLNGPKVGFTMYVNDGGTLIIEVPANAPPNKVALIQRMYPDAKIKFVTTSPGTPVTGPLNRPVSPQPAAAIR